MSLSFLVPAFLAGLAALAIPILVHLSRKETRSSVSFPSLMFVRRVPHPSTSRRAIHRWPLLLLRLLGLALLVLAFARPFVDREGADLLPDASGGRDVVVLLDRSYSMGLGDRWTRAVAAAEEAVAEVGRGDRGTVILFDSRAQAAGPTTMESAELAASLRGLEPGPRTTRYAPALRYAQRILSSSPMPRREVVLISDFQRAGWDADASEVRSISLPQGTTLRPVNVAEGEEAGNVTVAALSVDRSETEGRERATLTARIVRSGSETGAAEVPVVLEIDGRPVETRNVALGDTRSTTVSFAPVTLPVGETLRGRIRLPEDALAADNDFHFVVDADQRIGALVVEGPGTPPQASFYLERALQLAQSPAFRLQRRNVGQLTAADLESHPVLIFNRTPLPDGEVGRRIRERVEGGAGLVLVAGDNSLGEWEGVLPELGRTVDRSAQGGTALGFVDLGHPVFESFSSPRSGDFTAARVFRYRPIGEGPRALARFGDGGVALAEVSAGEGRVLIWSSSLDSGWNDLVLQPVFLPFVHQLARYAAGYAPAPLWRLVGEPFDPGAVDPQAEPYTLAISPAGERLEVDGSRPLTLEEPGFYELRDQRTGDRGTVVAVNMDPGEAAVEPFDPAELVAAVVPREGQLAAAGSTVPLTTAERERQQNAWWYLLVIAFLLLTAETVMSNRYYRAATPLKG